MTLPQRATLDAATMDFTISRLDFKQPGRTGCVNCEADLDPDVVDVTKTTRNAAGLPLMASVTCSKCGAKTSFRITE
jgi:RNase P subunit RPR2